MFPKNYNLGFLFPSTFAEQCWYCTKMKNLENTKKQINHHDHISGTTHDSFRCNRTWHAAHSIVLSLKYRSDGLRLDTAMTHPLSGQRLWRRFHRDQFDILSDAVTCRNLLHELYVYKTVVSLGCSPVSIFSF